MSRLVNIQQSITEIDPNKIYSVPILIGAPASLVSCRELRGHCCSKKPKTEKAKPRNQSAGTGYHTNREIKIWSFYFLLKAVTTSSCIHNWREEKQMLLTWTQMEERSFYRYLKFLEEKKLATVDKFHSIRLVSYQDAAHILDIVYSGTYTVEFNPYKYNGKQTFQHFLRAEEIEDRKNEQLTGMMNKLDKNPALKVDIILMLVRLGASEERLKNDSVYFQQRLLKCQQWLFKTGSDVLSYIYTRRADINRSVKKISDDHCYRSSSSVSYMKRIMEKHGIITIDKIKVVSQVRSRLYISSDGGKQKDAYKWFRDQKQTALILCDQINKTYEVKKSGTGKPFKKAA